MLDPKAIGTPDVFLYNRATGATSLVSHATVNATTAGNNLARNPSISGDGGFVAFDSYATTLVSGTDGGGTEDVFLYARSNGAVTLLSHTAASATTTSNGDSDQPHISANGAFVVTTHATTPSSSSGPPVRSP